MVNLKQQYTVFLLITLVAFAACKKDEPANSYPVTISFQNKAGDAYLSLNSTYTNPFGENITITNFKYYITNISFITTNGTETRIPDSYFLVDEKSPASKTITLTAGNNAFKGMRFLIGVDSTRNVSGVQSGALDPVNGMFWTWNTGYIQAKLEGSSPLSPEPFSEVTYHIGGFKTGENTVREISLNFPQTLTLTSTATSEVIIGADAMKWFNGVHEIRIADNSVCHSPGNLAVTISDNYARMFFVAGVINR